MKKWLAENALDAGKLLQANPAPLNHAVFNNHEEIVCLLLERDALGTSHLGKEWAQNGGGTALGRRFQHHPLRAAVEYGHLESVRAALPPPPHDKPDQNIRHAGACPP